jgi:Tol biopolymer transport system component
VDQPDGIFALSLHSGASHRLTTNPFGLFDTKPEISPDGLHMVFTRMKSFLPQGGALSAIFVMNLDDRRLRRLTPWRMNAAEPDWAPDSSLIAFNSADDRIEEAEVFLVRPDGTGMRKVTNAREIGSFRPCWGPTGKQIVLTRVDFGGTGTGAFRLFIMNQSGHHLRPINSSTSFENEGDWGTRR